MHLDPERPKPEHEDLVDVLIRVQKDLRQVVSLSNEKIKGVLTLGCQVDKNFMELDKIYDKGIEVHLDPKRPEPEHEDLVDVLIRVHKDLKQVVSLSNEKIKGVLTGMKFPQIHVFVNGKLIATDSNYWENPNEFQLERFVDSSIDFRGQNFEFLPCGASMRGCPGANFAVLLIEVALANILHRFDWELPNGMSREDLDMKKHLA
ncbi:cytochrome P450 71A9-like [Vitis riparia]|uniref:cytochrome P450 71A9-like n=1 Tax=Vitis riparia TaxID=96939 RepID=UPI00155A81D5|nr:cytochrome P450 71A9-like [Vitis riparia]